MNNDSITSRVQLRQKKLLLAIARDFSTKGLGKSPSRFSLTKLKAINSHYIKLLSLEEFVLRASLLRDKKSLDSHLKIDETSPFCYKLEYSKLHNSPPPTPTKADIIYYLASLLDQRRISVLSEYGSESKCVLDWQAPSQDDIPWKNSTLDTSLSNLQAITTQITHLYNFNPNPFPTTIDSIATYLDESSKWWESTIKQWLSEKEYNTGEYLWPLRVALSGQKKSPTPFELLSILTQEEYSSRISTVLSL